MNVWCIHGNLQRPSVWDCFDERFNREGTPVQLIKEDLYDQDLISYATWVDGFHDRVKREKTPGPNLLLGYSLGGRLAMHALLKEPTLWRGAVIIGADAGSQSEGDRAIRLKGDQRWGHRFATEPWHQVLADWDALPVFGNRPCTIPRPHSDFPLPRLEKTFDVFSKGRQLDLRCGLSTSDLPPILYLSGEGDPKYTEIGKELNDSCPTLKQVIICEAGHRVPWENAKEFIHAINTFINELT